MKRFNFLYASLFAASLSGFADSPGDLSFLEPDPLPLMLQVETPSVQEVIPVVAPAPKPVVKKIQEAPFSPFTGKVKGRKVRVRLHADVDSQIVKELTKNELVAVIGEKGDFWAIDPPNGVEAYIFRSFVLDGVIEANHVNVRLEPSLDAPILAHLNVGDKVEGVIAATNNKWLKIAPPAGSKVYIAKSYVEFAGGPELKAQSDKRVSTLEHLLDAATLLSKAELRKSFQEIDFDRVQSSYQAAIAEYTDFPELVEHAKEALASFQQDYLQKRILFLESQPQMEKSGVMTAESSSVHDLTDKMKIWQPLEEALYSSWAVMNENLPMQKFYEEERLNAVALTGMLEPYNSPVKSKPGDYIVRDGDLPVAYVYSTRVNLQNLVGQRVTLVATSRPNNNFAFPAYFVISAE